MRDPIQLPASTKLAQAMQVMADANNLCDVENQSKAQIHSNKSSCILVMEGDRLSGIVTERDLIKLLLHERDWETMTLGAVMSSPVVTMDLSKEELTPVKISQVLQKHRVRHLPILDAQGHIYGIITHRLLRHLIEAAHLLRFRFVNEVMVRIIVSAEKDDTLWDLVQLMVEHKIGSVVITEHHSQQKNALRAVGLVTEQDVLQFRSLGLELHQIKAEDVMAVSPQLIQATDSLVHARQIMQETRSDRLIVVGDKGEMVGLLTQSSLLEAMNQNEMFKLVDFLEQQIEERTNQLDQINKQLRQEIQERRRAEKRIQRLTLIDELTGLYNRRGFFLMAEQELKLTEQRRLSFSVFFIDIDNLKDINDNFGHEMGDQIIIDTAQHLKACFRKADVISRLGGDEFTCFTLANQEEAALIIQRLENAITQFNQRQKRPYNLSLSIGHVSYDEYCDVTLRELLKQADKKMYAQKILKKASIDHLD
ncbi:diguanylate cyclase [[Leptolyngbya] sp. PCC 7376]|uniref:diguanylate cyclase n=1 Tax=[Leptolyngbya] sp. PCC 7376 TaxID=111781 RepID=UPI001356D23D|nr:diguanylate cyclase [[Leptolyngbya] sp. PCC 7376]